uniref:Uncharacterized protein n=1 Tax=Pararge aegeria TaxID=116150 RepID=S4PGQ2_9NEOP
MFFFNSKLHTAHIIIMLGLHVRTRSMFSFVPLGKVANSYVVCYKACSSNVYLRRNPEAMLISHGQGMHNK